MEEEEEEKKSKCAAFSFEFGEVVIRRVLVATRRKQSIAGIEISYILVSRYERLNGALWRVTVNFRQ